jgi:3-oxocholest-4-en-26-oate---CoA ligase
MSIVGDAFAKPILRPSMPTRRWDISSLRVIVSSGVMWSKETKDGLLRHNRRLIMVDALGSSEAIGMATNTTTAGSGDGTAKFELGPNTRVVTEDGRDVAPGSGELGRVALRGHMPSATTRTRRSRQRRSR